MYLIVRAVWPARGVFITLTLLLAHQTSALRLPTWSQLMSRRRDGAAEQLLREVLSPHSAFHPGLASSAIDTSVAAGSRGSESTASTSPLDPARATPLGSLASTPGARGVSLRDPAISTVFSRDAAKRLPRLTQGPSIPLEPRPGARSTELQPKLEGDGGSSGTSSTNTNDAAPELERLRAADPPPPELDLEQALVAGRLASIAYCSHPDLLAAWNCSRCNDVPGFAPHAIVYDPVWDLAAYAGYHPPSNAVVLAFRGTDSSNWGQWAENMRYWRTDHMYPVPDFPHALIHSGFYSLWTGSSLQASFRAAVAELLGAHPGARLLAAGHSMGGALAQLAALEAKLAHNGTHVSVWTFGAPRVGNVAYQQLFNSFIDVSWRFTHNRDIVPSVPLQLMGFQHVAREVWEVDVEDPSGAGGDERKLLLCDASGEDPSCHNSACYLGLCTSIADHLVYLGLHMYQDSDEC